MTAPLNQTHTTSPTDEGVDRGSRPPVSDHITRALSGVFGGALLAVCVVASPVQAEVVTITPTNVHDYLSADALTL